MNDRGERESTELVGCLFFLGGGRCGVSDAGLRALLDRTGKVGKNKKRKRTFEESRQNLAGEWRLCGATGEGEALRLGSSAVGGVSYNGSKSQARRVQKQKKKMARIENVVSKHIATHSHLP